MSETHWPDVVLDPSEIMPRGIYTFHREETNGAVYTEQATGGLWYFDESMLRLWARKNKEHQRQLGFEVP